ncbi:MAG: hypothetical protein K0R08_1968 [Solimicrobium sp.]|jgi:hypothetical protein|nr:hypothetical protein [Solimicrobium sp.]
MLYLPRPVSRVEGSAMNKQGCAFFQIFDKAAFLEEFRRIKNSFLKNSYLRSSLRIQIGVFCTSRKKSSLSCFF